MVSVLMSPDMKHIWGALASTIDMNTADCENQHAFDKRCEGGFEHLAAANTLNQAMGVVATIMNTAKVSKRDRRQQEPAQQARQQQVYRKWQLIQHFHWQRARDHIMAQHLHGAEMVRKNFVSKDAWEESKMLFSQLGTQELEQLQTQAILPVIPTVGAVVGHTGIRSSADQLCPVAAPTGGVSWAVGCQEVKMCGGLLKIEQDGTANVDGYHAPTSGQRPLPITVDTLDGMHIEHTKNKMQAAFVDRIGEPITTSAMVTVDGFDCSCCHSRRTCSSKLDMLGLTEVAAHMKNHFNQMKSVDPGAIDLLMVEARSCGRAAFSFVFIGMRSRNPHNQVLVEFQAQNNNKTDFPFVIEPTLRAHISVTRNACRMDDRVGRMAMYTSQDYITQLLRKHGGNATYHAAFLAYHCQKDYVGRVCVTGQIGDPFCISEPVARTGANAAGQPKRHATSCTPATALLGVLCGESTSAPPCRRQGPARGPAQERGQSVGGNVSLAAATPTLLLLQGLVGATELEYPAQETMCCNPPQGPAGEAEGGQLVGDDGCVDLQAERETIAVLPVAHELKLHEEQTEILARLIQDDLQTADAADMVAQPAPAPSQPFVPFQEQGSLGYIYDRNSTEEHGKRTFALGRVQHFPRGNWRSTSIKCYKHKNCTVSIPTKRAPSIQAISDWLHREAADGKAHVQMLRETV